MNIQKMMQQAQQMQKQMAKKQSEFENTEHEFTKSGGAIKLKMNGACKILDLKIDEMVIDPEAKEDLEDMVMLAINEAVSDIKEAEAQLAPKMPGMGGMF